jgi:DNA-binding HxlR family transcriptional regulator
MKRNKSYTCALGCPVEATLDLIGGKWKGVVLYHLSDSVLRFNELRRRLSGITQRMLTRQLRELEESELIIRTVYAEVPPRVEYRLSPKGESLKPVIRTLQIWGENHLVEKAARLLSSTPKSTMRTAEQRISSGV